MRLSNLPVDVDSWKTKLSDGQTDHNYSSSTTNLLPVCTLADEIDLEPNISPRERTSAKGKGKNPLAPRPAITKKKNKKVQLNRIESLADLSRAGQGYNYGLPKHIICNPRTQSLG